MSFHLKILMKMLIYGGLKIHQYLGVIQWYAQCWWFEGKLYAYREMFLWKFLEFFFLFSIFKTPALFEDMINVSTPDAYTAICVSFGYFLYDTFDIVFVNGKFNAHSYEILTHHAIVSLFYD